MLAVEHISGLSACPHLPEVDGPIRASALKICGKARDEAFYNLALKCAQSLWLQGLPAQSLLLINRAFGADIDSEMAGDLPYAAAAWVMKYRKSDQFIGNPRRHYQHLATRMVEPRKELRSWRAWACWMIACKVFPDYPADDEQILKEGIVEPSRAEVFDNLARIGLSGESELWDSVVEKL